MIEYINILAAKLDLMLRFLGDFFSPALPILPRHIHEIFGWTVFFFATSAFVRLFIAPWLLGIAERHKVDVGESARKKWGHQIVSFINCLTTTFWAAYIIIFQNTTLTPEERVFGYDKSLGSLMSFSLGFFIWDLCICIRNIRSYGKGFLIHSLMGMMATLTAMRPFLIHTTGRFLLFETSTIFVNIHWFMAKLGYKRTHPILIINDAFGFLAYLSIRLVYGTILSVQCAKDLLLVGSKAPRIFILIAGLGNVITHSLNFYWFFKLGRSLMRSLFIPHEHTPLEVFSKKQTGSNRHNPGQTNKIVKKTD